MPTALMYAAQIMELIPAMLSAGKDITDLVKNGQTALAAMVAEKRDPTPAEWDALDAEIDALRKELHSE